MTWSLLVLLLPLLRGVLGDGSLVFSDWDGLQRCSPLTYTQPQSEEDIVEAVLSARSSNETLKVIGTGHSFSGVQMTHGHMISLEKYNRVLGRTDLPDGSALVQVQAGIRLRDLNDELEKMNLSLLNLGATAAQSVAGATATGTHGTGKKLGSISTQIHALRIVDSHGKVHEVSEKDEKRDLFDAARVGVGALGVISTMTFKTVSLFKLRKRLINYELPKLLKELPMLLDEYDRLQWYFTPYTNSATLLIREETTAPVSPEPTADDVGGCWSNKVEAGSDCTDISYKAMTDSLEGYEARTIYTEMEIFIPVEYTESAILDFMAYMEDVKSQHDPNVELFTGVRYVMEDSIFLSPMNGRNSSVISFIVLGNQNHTGSPREFELYASGLEKICESKYGGRPHWGKVNYVTHDYLIAEYGSYLEKFNEVRNKMDPDRVFTNDYLDMRL